ncbi:hypothetical protein AB852_16010 [Streptomyces uncialis]|uniref:Uncharacterized protein n=1 Tax=Streptomyces uncialis TaxID=1048205 RepID=A0A1Q4V987_9ACTN|nr:hypothetical protein AB852_16010 [Streptomyces uncialis]
MPDRHQSRNTRLVIDRLSQRTVSEIVRLERTRNYLQPGDVGAALRLWKDYVHRTERELWRDDELGHVDWYCCGNPFRARILLDGAMQAMSQRGARELRKIVEMLDEALGPSVPATDRHGHRTS